MPIPLPLERLSDYGVSTNHERMDNGQLRFRLVGGDGSSYIRCENPGLPAWENSHSHSALQELVLVQAGLVVFVELLETGPSFRALRPGQFAVTVPGIAHNECLAQGTVIHTVKYGDCAHPDWIPSPELDRATKHLDFSRALRLAEACAGR